MRIGWLWALLLTTCSMLVTTGGVAWAHVEVGPEEAPAGEFQRFVVSAPTEREDVPTTEVRVEVPEGFLVGGVQPVPGWEAEFEEEGGVVRAITWSGGEIRPREFQEFIFSARTPQEAGQYAWRAHQTYGDGEVVGWTGAEDAEHPASLVQIVEDGAGPGGAEAEKSGTESATGTKPATESAAQSSPSGFTPIAAYGGLGLGAVALVVALLALLMGRRKAS
jgi:uncharacterized protein YcnI